jgi:hypothetical protein
LVGLVVVVEGDIFKGGVVVEADAALFAAPADGFGGPAAVTVRP